MDVVDAGVTGNPYTDSLIYQRWAGYSLTFSFPTGAADFTGYSPGSEPFDNFEVLNAAQQAAVRAIFAQISSFTNLVFTEQTGSNAATAVLRFGMTDGVGENVIAHAYLPSTTELGGDSWYANTAGYNDNPLRGNDAWHTFLHEIGHSLGLAHPHEPVNSSPMPSDRDSMIYTVMSYDGYPAGFESGWAQTYMIEDIAALQFLYGANYNHNNTDTIYRWNPDTGEMTVNGVGQGVPTGNDVLLTVWDGGGSDTYDFSNYAVTEYDGVRVDLRPGQWSQLPASAGQNPAGIYAPGNIANAELHQGNPASLIENAIGTAANDHLYGNDAANRLLGGAGHDLMQGFYGDDELLGEVGSDILYGHEGNDRLIGAEGGDSLYGGDGDDILDGGADPDGLIGGSGNDVLTAGDDSDVLYGEGGDDILDGGDGDDLLDGGGGSNTLRGGAGDDTYRLGLHDEVGTNLIVELDGEGTDRVESELTFSADGISIEHIFLTGFEAIDAYGNGLDNRLVGNSAGNTLDGGAGADVMRGNHGDDVYFVDNSADQVFENRGMGTDTVYSSVSFVLAERDPEFDPWAGASMRPWSAGDNEIEFLILTGAADIDATGNQFGNTVVGNTGDNHIDGAAGNDTLYSGAGSDSLSGGLGNDILYFGAEFGAGDFADGGADRDALVLQGNYGHVFSPGNIAGLESISLQSGSRIEWGDLGDNRYSYALTTVDANVAAGAQLIVNGQSLLAGEDFVFNGSAETDGAFLFYGGHGTDTLIGGAGNDIFFFEAERGSTGDAVAGGGGVDALVFARGNGLHTLVFTDGSFSGIESISVNNKFATDPSQVPSYDLTLANGNVAPGGQLIVNGQSLGDGQTLTVDGSAVVDGRLLLFGGAGNDTLLGGAQGDLLYGGDQSDSLTGGGGNDVFRFDTVAHTLADRITDFTIGDLIDLGRIDASTLADGDQAFAFIGSAAFSGSGAASAGELRAENAGGSVWLVQGDTDGNGVADIGLFVTVTDADPLTAADFAL